MRLRALVLVIAAKAAKRGIVETPSGVFTTASGVHRQVVVAEVPCVPGGDKACFGERCQRRPLGVGITDHGVHMKFGQQRPEAPSGQGVPRVR
jgi:hypothetical protein